MKGTYRENLDVSAILLLHLSIGYSSLTIYLVVLSIALKRKSFILKLKVNLQVQPPGRLSFTESMSLAFLK